MGSFMTCRRKKRHACKPEGKRPLGGHRHRLEYNSKIDPQVIDTGC
jgi:hypothetical protein